MKKLRVIVGFILLAVPTTLFAHSGATGIVKERMDMFKKNQGNLKAIKSHIRSEDYGSIIKLADEIRDWAVKMPEYFPEDFPGQTLTVFINATMKNEAATEQPSRSIPAIWTDFDGFKNAAMKNEIAAKQLIAAAKAEDQKAVVDGFKAVAASSKSCHQSYKPD